MCTTTLQILKFVHSPKTQNYKYLEKKTFFLQIKSFIHYFLGAITLAKKILAKKIQKKNFNFVCFLNYMIFRSILKTQTSYRRLYTDVDECRRVTRRMQISIDESLDKCRRVQTSHWTSVDKSLDECRQVQASVDEGKKFL